MIVPAAGSDVKPITHSPGLVLHSTTEKILRAAKDLQESKQATTPMPLSPEVSSPLMEIIPPPSSHQLQVTTEQEESATSVAPDGNFTFASEPQLSTTTQYTHTPLTESEIDDAKNLVLDLLGWGVDPEYLVTSGVHPALIYRIFTDLNLRLPTNLVLFEDG